MKQNGPYKTILTNCPTCGSEVEQTAGGVTNYFIPKEQPTEVKKEETQEELLNEIGGYTMGKGFKFYSANMKILKSKFTITRK